MRELSPLEARLTLARNGYSAIPVNGKIPHIRGWQTWFHRDAQVIHQWDGGYPDHRNTSVLTRDNPFLDLDITNEDAVIAARDFVLDRYDSLPLRIGNAPKCGFLFQISGETFAKITAELIAPDGKEHRIEFLCNGNQVVVHGMHPDIGRAYVWHDGSPFALKHDELRGITGEEAAQLVDAIVELLVTKFNYRLKRETHAPSNGADIRSGTPDWYDRSDFLNHDDVIALCMKLQRSGMEDRAIVNHVRALIERYAPDDDPARKARRMEDVPRAVRDGRAKIGKSITSKLEKPETLPTLVSFAELKGQTFMPVQWVIPEYIPEGLTLLCGKPKVGKSCLALAITLACACGDQVLGKTCQPCDVLYCALEEIPRRMHERTGKILGSQESWPANAWFILDLPPLDKGCIEALTEYLRQRPTIKLIIIDILANIKGKKIKGEDAYDRDIATMKALWSFAHQNSVNIIVIHHLNKSKAEDIFQSISGTLGLNGGADTLVVLDQKAKDDPLRFAVKGREVGYEDKEVDFDYDMGTWDVMGNWDDDDGASSKSRDLIKAALAGETKPLSPAQVAQKTGLKETTVRGTMRRMAKDKTIRRTEYGAYLINSVSV